MYTPIVENLKGMAYVEDLDAFENFVMDFYIIDNAVFTVTHGMETVPRMG